ncbi:RICIN domain-containing protein [Streptomyces goshikiensis]|uniref:RICIN domain-containing protein n=1 Tax=Streptomyces goshikiensis TaxID=1942 RepID=UPI0036DD734E
MKAGAVGTGRRVVFMLALSAAGALLSSPASADSATNIVNMNSGKCLEVADWSKANGAAVRQWTCGDFQANQMWYEVKGADGSYQIVNQNSGKCLEIADWSQADGAVARQWTCTGGANQKWFSAWANNGKLFMNANSYKYLEIADWSRANGAGARQWTGGWPSSQEVQKNQAWGQVGP